MQEYLVQYLKLHVATEKEFERSLAEALMCSQGEGPHQESERMLKKYNVSW